ncbi:STAS domain-containing protein [Streptomyces goshikiensis]|uniref:STAS domain-containing protein n=1 Tax=Streptomyces goshikiensis TaxID=1942 RepID=UPI0036540B91
MDTQQRGESVLVSANGELDEEAGATLRRSLDGIPADARDLLVDLYGVVAMDRDGLLHLLDLHRRAESAGLRVLVTGWQPQPQQVMAQIAGIPGPSAATGERYALAGFRRLIEQRAQASRDMVGFTAGWLPPGWLPRA